MRTLPSVKVGDKEAMKTDSHGLVIVADSDVGAVAGPCKEDGNHYKRVAAEHVALAPAASRVSI